MAAAAQPTFQLTASPNNGTWGSVSPSNATYAAGTSVQLSATAKPYYQFASWSNGVSGTANPVTVTLQSNTSVTAVFKELLTTNNPTPYWWLASYGYTNNFEAAAAAIGSNGMPRWQSYVAGLNPNSATNQLRIAVKRSSNGLTNVLSWATVTGRVYTVWWSTNITNKFVALSGASNLAANVQSVTNVSTTVRPTTYYRIEVKKL